MLIRPWWIMILSLLLACQPSPDASQESSLPEGAANARLAPPPLGPGELSADLYQNDALGIRIPVLPGWTVADRQAVEQAFQSLPRNSSPDSLPAMFLLTCAQNQPEGIEHLPSQYFLQLESTRTYPDLQSDPQAYLAAVRDQLVAGRSGANVVGPRPDTIGGRQVQRLDLDFDFGQQHGQQTYFSWTERGLFLNLVFTYEGEADWQLLEDNVIQLLKL